MRLSPILAFMFVATQIFAQSIPDQWSTPYEKSGGRKTPRYAETMEYCRRLQKASPWIRVTSFGKSPEGRDLPLIIVSKDKAFDPASAARSSKAILLIQNAIHAGEMDGKDACLMLMRDIAINKTKASLLDHLILLIIPIYSVDGHERFGPYNRINQNGPDEMGWRVTSENLNLNRDYLKADAPETQAWLKLFNAWLPDFFIDCHVTDGADYQYIVTFGLETHESVAPPVRSWIREKYLPAISTLKTNGVPVGPLVFLHDDLDPMKGLQGGGSAPPRFSTVYTTLQNRPGMLIEMHMLKDYKSRVEGIYRFLNATMEILNKEATSLRQAVRLADTQASTLLPRPFVLQYRNDSVPNTKVHFLGIKQRNEKSDVSGGIRRIYTGEPFEADVPYYDSVTAAKSVEPPVAYIIPQQWEEVIRRLQLHGLKLERLKEPADLTVEEYRFSHAAWEQRPFEGRHTVSYSVEKISERMSYPSGTIILRLNQRAARVALHALEPDAPDAFVSWGFFDAVFEQKEYAEDYVLEKMGREMLAKDPVLKQQFETQIANDSVFARSPSARLDFFYRHSPYWDRQVDLYPVARLMQDVPLITEPFK